MTTQLTTERLREIADGAMGIGAPLVLTQAEQVSACAELLAKRKECASLLAYGKALLDASQKLMTERDAARGKRDALKQENAQKDAAYRERDRLVCALSKLLPSFLARHPQAEAWEDDWRWIVFVQLPTGQASWHIHDSEREWFDHLVVRADGGWDGHTTEEKYRRLDAIAVAAGGMVPHSMVDAARAEAEHFKGYEADLACIRKVLDEVDAPHDCEDGASLEPTRIRLLAEQLSTARAELALWRSLVTEGEPVADVLDRIRHVMEEHAKLVSCNYEAERDAAREACERKHQDGWAWLQLSQQREAELDQARAEIDSKEADLAGVDAELIDAGVPALGNRGIRVRDLAWSRDAARAEAEKLRAVLIACGRNAGGGMADSVSTEFLMHVPEQVRLHVEKLRAELAAAVDSELAHKAKWESICKASRENGTCACSYDSIDDVCMSHSPKLAAAVAELDAVKRQRDELLRAKTGKNPDDLFCCTGLECGCQGVTVGEYELYCVDRAIKAASQPAQQPKPPVGWFRFFGVTFHPVDGTPEECERATRFLADAIGVNLYAEKQQPKPEGGAS